MNWHEEGLKIPDTDISEVNENPWKGRSQTSEQYYNVSKTATLCCYDHCSNKCHINLHGVMWTSLCMSLSWFQ